MGAPKTVRIEKNIKVIFGGIKKGDSFKEKRPKRLYIVVTLGPRKVELMMAKFLRKKSLFESLLKGAKSFWVLLLGVIIYFLEALLKLEGLLSRGILVIYGIMNELFK